MNKYKVTLLIVLTCLLTACGYRDYLNRNGSIVSGQAVSGGAVVKDSSAKPSFSQKNVSGSAVSGGGIHSSDNVTAKMQQAEFWIDKTVAADQILMDTKEIQEFNTRLREQLAADSKAIYYDLDKYGESLDGITLRSLIGDSRYTPGTLFIGENELTEEQWNSFQSQCNREAVADFNRIRYGITCSRADVRAFPTTDHITDVRGDTGHDVMQDTALAINEPVLIVHTSKDNRWYYVIANEYAGWVLQDQIALCRDHSQWQSAREMRDFILITGDEIHVKAPLDTEAGDLLFTMGTKLAIADEAECRDFLKERTIYDNYIVKVPVRTKDGGLDHQLVPIPMGKDISHGYLEYTKGNVLRQAFKLLGNPYGWGGMNGGRDCSSMTRDIYLCFGFRLPRDAATQGMISGKNCISLAGMSGKEKREKMNSVQPGTILQMPGHVMIYLGCQDHHYYVISANGLFVPDSYSNALNSEKGVFQTRLVTVNDLGVRSPSNGKTWGEQITAILGIP